MDAESRQPRIQGLFLFFLFIFIISGLNAQEFPTAPLPYDASPPWWRQALGGAVTGPPAAQAESVVMVCDGGNVKAYSWQGRPLWDYFARGRLMPYITRSREGTSYICRTSGILIALNRAGRELWRINLGEALAAPVITGWDGRIFVFTPRRIICYTASGYTLWSKQLEKPIALPPAKDEEGGFFLVLEDGELLRINAFGRTITEKLASAPVTAAVVRLAKGNSILFFYHDGTMELLNTADGGREPLKGIPQPLFPVAAAGWGSNAALLMNDGKAAYLSMDQRRILWTGGTHLSPVEITGNFEANLFADERGIYLTSRTGASAFADDGRRLWTIRLRGTAAIPSFSDEGVLYSGGQDWILNAYKLEERVRAQRRVLYGPASEGNYGTGEPHPELWAGYYFRYNEEDMRVRFGEISRAVQEGGVGEHEKEYASRLMDIAGSSLKSPGSELQPPVFVRYRVEAVRLLAYIGSRETVPFLAELFTLDNDALVKAAAAEALGKIGVDPEGLALQAFSNAVFPPGPLRDEHALTSVAAATGAICRFSGPPLSDAGVRILTSLAAPDRPPQVRNQAERELKTLRR
ncbi:MAG: PQQ-like beta-propeller repeat protein [Treponema sp.]|jgi:outer membrane protein assembly factor BamB|nr:PQQ-like beta-propeller repeat protein [Treponema sp.]